MSTQPPPAAPDPHAPAAPTVMAELFAARTARMEPLYARARLVLAWCFRIGAALLLLGIILSVVQRQPLNQVASGFDAVGPSVLRGEAAGVVDLAILWFMASPVWVVLIVAVGFFQLGQRRYGVLSLLVLLVLGVSIGLALGR